MAKVIAVDKIRTLTEKKSKNLFTKLELKHVTLKKLSTQQQQKLTETKTLNENPEPIKLDKKVENYEIKGQTSVYKHRDEFRIEIQADRLLENAVIEAYTVHLAELKRKLDCEIKVVTFDNFSFYGYRIEGKTKEQITKDLDAIYTATK